MSLIKECILNSIVGATSSYLMIPYAPALAAGTICSVSYTVFKTYATEANDDTLPGWQRTIHKLGSLLFASQVTRFSLYAVGFSFAAELSIASSVYFLLGSIPLSMAAKVYNLWQEKQITVSVQNLNMHLFQQTFRKFFS